MKMNISFIFILFIILGLSSLVNSQTDSCSSNLNLNGLIPFETTSLHCYPVWDSQGFILRYLQNRSNIWSFVLSAPDTNSYVAIGFSDNGKMVGSSAIVGWVSDAGVIKQYYLGGTTPDQVMPDQGSLQVVENSAAIILQSSRLYLAFQLNTTQPQSRLIYSVGQRDTFPPPNYRLLQHRDQVSTSLNYVTGQSTSLSPHSRLRKSHGVLNMLGWGILMLIGAITARYFRQWDPIWFYAHVSIQLLGFIFGLSGLIAGFVLDNLLGADVAKHKGIGIFILVLGCLQVMALLGRPDKASKVRKYWNWYHYSLGSILIVFAISNVFYGIHLGGAGSGWKVGYGSVLAILFLVAIVLEVKLWMRK
ncbi:hypothetical protein HHK36_013308 [Tetracentron sinense]|uniref:Cytochrome b561 and DOMON domain-containing protein n=1 Tax=Tetracentron sinense TaxID=13715 RepID=A0A834Z6B9_TETSI|nr:hypothetical protein HHK36_013308 [Tetracentron sinense]